MTMTDSPPAAVAVADESGAAADGDGASGRSMASGLVSLVMTGDHKTVGRMFIGTSLLFAVGAAVLGVLLGLERLDPARPDHVFGGLNAYFQMWTLYRVTLIFLVVLPLIIGLATLVVPLQVGATNIAFPRAALASFWTWLIGAVVIIASVFAGGGWGALDGVTADERDAIALTLLGTVLVVAALLLAAVNLATTVISLRTAGMNLLRVPLFAWSMLVASVVWLFTLPIALANIVFIYADLRGRDPISFGNPESGDIWAQLDWLTEQPAVYALLIPVLGIVCDIVPVAAGVRQARHAVLVSAIALFGLLSIGGWSQNYLTQVGTGRDHRDELLYVAFGIAVVLPVLAIFAGLGDSLRRGMKNVGGVPSAMLLGSLAALLLIDGATVSGLLRVIEPFELLERSTNTGIFNAVAVAALAGATAGLWFWSSKIFGSPLPEGQGRGIAMSLLLGGFLLAAADVVAGFFLADDVQVGEHAEGIVDVFNVISLIGAIIVGLGLIGVLAAVAGAARVAGADNDPWSGHTLEWATASPPPSGNFDEPHTASSERPLLDLAEAAEEVSS